MEKIYVYVCISDLYRTCAIYCKYIVRGYINLTGDLSRLPLTVYLISSLKRESLHPRYLSLSQNVKRGRAWRESSPFPYIDITHRHTYVRARAVDGGKKEQKEEERGKNRPSILARFNYVCAT